jgi:CO/xanthine dehydrogenase Mo-binding subunit
MSRGRYGIVGPGLGPIRRATNGRLWTKSHSLFAKDTLRPTPAGGHDESGWRVERPTRAGLRAPAACPGAPAPERTGVLEPTGEVTTRSAPRPVEVGHIGKVVPRADGIPKVKGEFAFSSDLVAPGMLWGHTVRSPHAHARIRAIDVSEAVKLPGVHAVLTHDDVPGEKRYGLEFADQPVLAIDRVLYFGEPVALVAAEHPEQARRAAEKVRVDYEPLEPVADMERALDGPDLHPERPTAGHGYRDDPRPNVVRHIEIRHGDPDAAAEVVVTGTYELGSQDQAFLGPESGLVVPDGEGGVDIYVATQWLHVDRRQIAPCLGLPPEQVRIHLAGVGGAFGGREDLSMQIHGAMLALHTNRPIKIVYSREESFTGHVHRHPARIWAEHRATREGKLVNVRMRILLDGGAYASSSTAVCSNAAAFACGPYNVPNALLESTAVYTNNPPCGAMRGFGAVQTCFAAEAQMDKLAAELGIDPIELRLLNALGTGDTLPTGQPITGSLPVAEVIREAAALEPPRPEELPRDPLRLPGGAGNTTRGEGVRRGVGFAVGFKNIGFSEGFDDYCAARVRLFEDGSAEVFCAAAEVGQGVTGVMLQVARTELGTEDVQLAPHSTASVDSAGSTSASRQTWMVAGAVREACRAALAEREARGGGEVDVERIYRHLPTSPLDPETGQLTGDRAHVAFAVCAMRVVAEVDVDLGLTRVVWIGAAQDVGKAINPLSVEGQVEGGTAQGLGLALMEEIQTKDGRITNASFTDYLIPTALDMPDVETVLVEVPEPDAPYGVKGIGEPPTVAATAAVVSALRDATGRELSRVPVRPDDIVGF